MIAILALQGAFAEHQQMLHTLGEESVLIRNLDDWNDFIENTDKRGLIIPGGESTAMMRIIRDENLLEPIRKAILDGMPVFGTCAGLIMLDSEHLGTMDIEVKRNAYGRQLGSFFTTDEVKGIGPATKKLLLKAFKSVKRIREASVDQLAAVIGPAKAKILAEALQ